MYTQILSHTIAPKSLSFVLTKTKYKTKKKKDIIKTDHLIITRTQTAAIFVIVFRYISATADGEL